jgi:hypothetical protein
MSADDNVITAEQYRALLAERRQRKFGNEPIVVDGERFDSTGEAARWGELVLLREAGYIANLRRQVRFPLIVGGVKIADYVADYVYEEWHEDEQGVSRLRPVVEDYKSPATRTPAYKLKRRLMFACHQIAIRETGKG